MITYLPLNIIRESYIRSVCIKYDFIGKIRYPIAPTIRSKDSMEENPPCAKIRNSYANTLCELSEIYRILLNEEN